MISIELVEIDNGWTLSVFNDTLHTKEVEDTYCKTLVDAIKELQKRVETVRELKEE
jgi:hypothetical protein